MLSIEEARATCIEAIAAIDAGWTKAPTKDEQKAVDAADAYALAVLEEMSGPGDPVFVAEVRAHIKALGISPV